MDVPQLKPHLIIRIPLPNADISEEDIGRIKTEFGQEGIVVGLKAEEIYPCCGSWAEIAVGVGAFLGGVAASHYSEKLFDALDRFLRKGIEQINLNLLHGLRHTYRDIPRNERVEAIALIKKALEELESLSDAQSD